MEEKITYSLVDRIVIFALVVSITILCIVSSTGVVIATPLISGYLALSENQNIWITTGFLMVVAATVPCAIYLAEKFGYKQAFIAGTIIYLLSSFLMGFSSNYSYFLSLRLISGIGVGIVFPVSLSVLAQTFTKEAVNLILVAYVALGFGLGSSLGYLCGGVVSQYYNWQPIFFLIGISGIPLVGLSHFFLKKQNLRPVGGFDFIGYALFIIFICSLIMVLANAKAPWNTEGWRSSFILFFSLLAVVSLIALIIEEKEKINPLFFLELFRIESFAIGSLILFFIGGTFFSSATMFPLILINLFKYSKIQAAITMFPYGLSMALAGAISGFFIKEIGIRKTLLIGGALVILDSFLQHSLSIYSDRFFITTLLVIRGLGVGMTMGPVTAWSLKDIKLELKGNGSILVTIFRQVGGGLTVSWINLFAYDRYKMHIQHFFEAFAFQKRGINKAISDLSHHNYMNYGANPELSQEQSKVLIIETIERQARLLSFNDAYFIIGIVMGALFLFVAFKFVKETLRERTSKE